MTSAETKVGGNLLSSGIDPKTNYTHCKEEGHNLKKNWSKLTAKKEGEAKDGKKPKLVYPKCPTCEKTNHPAERCWKGADAHLKPQRNKTEDKETTDETNSPLITTLPHRKHQIHYSKTQTQKTNFATTQISPVDKKY